MLQFTLQNDISREEDDGLPKGSRQLKLPPDKQGSSNKALNHNRTTRVKLDRKSLNFEPACEVSGKSHTFFTHEWISNIKFISKIDFQVGRQWVP